MIPTSPQKSIPKIARRPIFRQIVTRTIGTVVGVLLDQRQRVMTNDRGGKGWAGGRWQGAVGRRQFQIPNPKFQIPNPKFQIPNLSLPCSVASVSLVVNWVPDQCGKTGQVLRGPGVKVRGPIIHRIAARLAREAKSKTLSRRHCNSAGQFATRLPPHP